MTTKEFETEMGIARETLDATLRDATPADFLQPHAVGEWSRADVLAHLAGYTRSIADDLAVSRGGPRSGPDYQAPADSTVDEYNEITVTYWRKRPLSELLEEERAAFAALTDEVLALSDEALVDENRFAFTTGRSLAAILPNNSYAHYHMHLPEMNREHRAGVRVT